MSLQTCKDTPPPTWLKTSKSCATYTLSCRSPTYSEVVGNAAEAVTVGEGCRMHQNGIHLSTTHPSTDAQSSVRLIIVALLETLRRHRQTYYQTWMKNLATMSGGGGKDATATTEDLEVDGRRRTRERGDASEKGADDEWGSRTRWRRHGAMAAEDSRRGWGGEI